MATTNNNQLISEQINDILQPLQLIEENDEIEAKFDDFDEFRGEYKNGNFGTSEIRKQNIKQLHELDSKYMGKVVSRKELNQEDGDITESEKESSENESLEDTDDDDDDLNSEDLSQFTKKDYNRSSQGKEDLEKTQLVKKVQENDVEIKKGLCVQNQLKLWENLLEVRIKAQKMLITANSLPDYDSFLDLSEIGESMFLERTESACDNLYALIDNLVGLQTILIENFSETKDLLQAGSKRRQNKPDEDTASIFKRSKLAGYADKIEDNYSAYTGFRNQTLQKWHDRTKTLKDSRNSAMDLGIVNKIENALLGKHEMIRKTQLYRGDFEMFGSNSNNSPATSELILPEIFDDSDFYHQLLRELIEYKSNIGDNQSEITQKFIELQKVRSKMKRKVEIRASKGRKIRYNVHNKLVNFMPPRDDSVLTDDAKTELYNSLFGNLNN